MGNFGNRKDSPGFWLSFFLLLGAAAGTLFCNWPDSGWKEALRDAGSGMVTAAMLLKLDFMGLFFTVLRKRLGGGLLPDPVLHDSRRLRFFLWGRRPTWAFPRR